MFLFSPSQRARMEHTSLVSGSIYLAGDYYWIVLIVYPMRACVRARMAHIIMVCDSSLGPRPGVSILAAVSPTSIHVSMYTLSAPITPGRGFARSCTHKHSYVYYNNACRKRHTTSYPGRESGRSCHHRELLPVEDGTSLLVYHVTCL